jgi:hypothetical protein
MNNLNIYAVPVSTYAQQGDRILLSDRIAKEEEKLSGPQWYDILESKFEESAKKGDPVVLIFDNQITGRDADYLEAYLNFIDYALSKKATFVTTSELVKMSKAKKPVSTSSGKSAATSNTVESGCIACDALENATINATFENKTASADMVVSVTQNFKD